MSLRRVQNTIRHLNSEQRSLRRKILLAQGEDKARLWNQKRANGLRISALLSLQGEILGKEKWMKYHWPRDLFEIQTFQKCLRDYKDRLLRTSIEDEFFERTYS